MADDASQASWAEIDHYIVEHLVPHDEALDAALDASTAAGLPSINVAPNQGALLGLLATMTGARDVLEIGTLGGYSTIWLARALQPGGHLVSLEASARHADVARANIARAGLADVVEVRVGPALATLPLLEAEGAGPFDMVFVDADKASNPEYFAWALRLARVGALVVVDNVVRQGRLVDATTSDPDILGTRRLFDVVAAEPRVRATAIQTVGSKGHDGVLVALVVGA
ncbi:MAG: O-methyltransferase [Acidimicrobiales bacterium]